VKVLNIQNQKQIEAKKAKEAQEMAIAEGEKIQKYVAENNITQTLDANGVYFIEKKAGNGAMVEKGKYAVIQFIGEILGGSTFGNTYESKEPVNYMVGTGRLGIGFDDCIMKMKKGGKALMIIPASQAFGGEGNGYMIPPFATLKIEVEIVDIVTEKDLAAKKDAEAKVKQAKEQGELKKFIQTKYPKAKMTASGLYYNEEKAGTGKQALLGSKVKVNYLGTLLDGTKFDSSYDRKTPFDFTIGMSEVIPGWDEGVAMMKEGGKATLIIPSKIGYGAAGSGPIPPFASLVFEIELISVSPSPLK
jgi:FKBP-type peptidyl-prolyl cis-trans isomerase